MAPLTSVTFGAMVTLPVTNGENGDRLRTMILSKGNSTDLMSLFTAFTGHQQVDLTPLLVARGLK